MKVNGKNDCPYLQLFWLSSLTVLLEQIQMKSIKIEVRDFCSYWMKSLADVKKKLPFWSGVIQLALDQIKAGFDIYAKRSVTLTKSG